MICDSRSAILDLPTSRAPGMINSLLRIPCSQFRIFPS